MWAELRDHGPEDWGPFGAERLRLSTRLVIWVTLAVLFLVDALLALGDTGVTSSSELPQLAAGYVLIGLMVLHTPLGVVAIVLALVLGDRWWDHDAISLLFAGAATILGMSARLPLILVSGSFFVVWLVVAGRVLDRLSPVSASLLAFSAVGGLAPGLGLRWLSRRLRSAVHLAEDRRVQLERAQSDERHRLALELHDVVGHGLTIISTQAAMLPTLTDPDRREAAERAISDTARQSLQDLRTMLGVLRGTGASETAADATEQVVPVEELMGDYAARLRSAGYEVEVDLRLSEDIPDSLLHTLQRLVQESTTIIFKHAAREGRVDILLAHSSEETVLRVCSPMPAQRRTGPVPNTGFGLAGMDERARILGGRLTHGPEDGRALPGTPGSAGRQHGVHHPAPARLGPCPEPAVEGGDALAHPQQAEAGVSDGLVGAARAGRRGQRTVDPQGQALVRRAPGGEEHRAGAGPVADDVGDGLRRDMQHRQSQRGRQGRHLLQLGPHDVARRLQPGCALGEPDGRVGRVGTTGALIACGAPEGGEQSAQVDERLAGGDVDRRLHVLTAVGLPHPPISTRP